MNIRCFDSPLPSGKGTDLSTSIKVLLIHPHKIYLDALCHALQNQEDMTVTPVMLESIHGNSICQHHHPDVVVVGMNRLPPNAMQDIKNMASICANSGVVVFLDIDAAWQIRRAFEAGVKGCVLVSASLSELVYAIRSTFEGRMYMCPESVRHMLEDRNGSGVIDTDAQLSLGEREGQVLRLIADGYSSKEIARNLNIAPGTVDVHRRNIMRKVGLHKVADLTRYALRNQMVGL